MKITGIRLSGVRCFKELPRTDLSERINIFVGPNNSGKSTLLKAIYLVQRKNSLSINDKTLNSGLKPEVHLFFERNHLNLIPTVPNENYLRFMLEHGGSYVSNGQNTSALPTFPTAEPDNLIYPYLSKRKVTSYSDQINESQVNAISENFSNLFAKIDRLVTPEYQPGNSEYLSACENILGFKVSTLAKGNGKHAVQFIHNSEHIPLTSMGEGVPNMLGLITDLCIAENRIFLIEELENDIHPKALKALLRLIEEKSETNQFFISTHSNIVMKHLGAVEGAKVFRVDNDIQDETRPNLMLSRLTEISEDPYERRKALEDLGYDLFDFDLWKGWLFLEESSAEVIIRDFLIPWFVPELQHKLRTFSANSISGVIPKFEDFNKLFVFLHLEPSYKNQVWVYIDGGDQEARIIEEFKEKYGRSGWQPEQFGQFSEHDFESYYPSRFEGEVNTILAMPTGSRPEKKAKREKKRNLIEDVKKWCRDHKEEAMPAFEESAKEIIDILRGINDKL